MRIKVGVEHTSRGVRNSLEQCPLAIALKELGFTNVSAGRSSVTAVWRGRSFHAYVPPDISKKLSDYDNGGNLAPFVFDAEFEDLGAA